ncbi:hypothetical protein SBDP1_830018 [Syntrophobacter sp. SbD1]|nr:hypothetical protein SBDP1_830018 [Syntrophobacter sp. SbD1]
MWYNDKQNEIPARLGTNGSKDAVEINLGRTLLPAIRVARIFLQK